MASIPHPLQRSAATVSAQRLMSAAMLLLLTLVGAGCKGRSIKVENPVFAEAPPRRSLNNQAADVEESRLAQLSAESDDSPLGVDTVGHSKLETGVLTGSSVVAEVNGKPIFVDDVLGGGRQIIEADPRLKDHEKQAVIQMALRKRLPKYIEDELVMQAVEKKIPRDKREMIRESLEPKFQEFLERIKKENNFSTDEELEEKLAKEGSTIKSLRDLFLRSNMVDSYVFSLCKVPETIDREELLKYYDDHISEYTPIEKVRYAEIVIRFAEHGGEDGAKKAMANVVNQLLAGKEFGDVAQAMSDSLSAEQRGDKGWITRGELSDKSLEEMLFELPVGEMTRVIVRAERYEVYKVIDHRKPERIPFQTVQKEIEEKLLSERRIEATEQVRKDFVARANVITIFDNSPPIGVTPVSGTHPARTPF